jgi:putative transport protein
MDWLVHALQDNPELALFLTLALGYLVGRIRLAGFQLGPMVGVLVVGLAIGQVGIDLPDAMRSTFFLLSVFAIGFKTGPEFFRSLRSSALPQLALAVLFVIVALAVTWVTSTMADFPRGTAAGLIAGALTNSTAIGTATTAVRGLPLEPAAKKQMAQTVATTYALTYVVGLLLVVWFLPTCGPRLMGVHARDVGRDYEHLTERGSVNSAYRDVVVRAYRLPSALDKRTVDQVEHLWPPDLPVAIAKVRRAGALLEATSATGLQAGDTLAVTGRSQALASDSNPLKVEVSDRELLEGVPNVSAELVVTNRNLAGQTVRTIARGIGARGIFLTAIKRGGRELPFTLSTVVERGDVLSVSGTRAEVDRVAREIGYAEYPTTATDLFMVAVTIAIGGLIGLIPLISVSIGKPVGVLLAGLTLGHLRSLNPKFGRIPAPSALLLESLGMSSFLALVGLEAGPAIRDTLQNSGFALLGATIAVALIPQVVTILVGYYLLRMNPGILLGVCAGAATAGGGLAAVEEAAGSRVPSLGYGVAYAAGNILTALSATLLVLMSSP